MDRSSRHAAIWLLLVVACDGGGDGGACTLIGCDSGAELALGAFPESDVARLTGARIEVCLNTTCRDRVIDALPPPHGVTHLLLGTSMEPRIGVTLARTAPGGAIEIGVEIRSTQPALFVDGDVYTVALVAADTTPLVDRAWSVSYQTSQPNGPNCEPTCRSAATVTEL